jgi:hypothetical protein
MRSHSIIGVPLCLLIFLAACATNHANGGEKGRPLAHDRPHHITTGWIRDPYIVLSSDGYYYLTGTTPLPNDPREKTDPYNTGLKKESIVGWKMQVWRSRDLVSWESLGAPFTLKDGIWFTAKPAAFKKMPGNRSAISLQLSAFSQKTKISTPS